MARYFRVGQGSKIFESGSAGPYEIDLCFEPVPCPVAFSEGVCHGSAACMVSVDEALQPTWRDFFSLAQAEWLIPILEQWQAGIRPAKIQILLEVERRTGKPVASYEAQTTSSTV
jgi:hypothetical protein